MPRRSNRESDGSVRPPSAGTKGQASSNLEFRTRDALTGRSPKLTKVVEETVCQAVGAGVPYTTACALAGISRKTAEEWVRRGEGRARGRPSAPRYAAFATALARARAEDETARIARITEAARGGAVVYRRTNRKPDGTVAGKRRRIGRLMLGCSSASIPTDGGGRSRLGTPANGRLIGPAWSKTRGTGFALTARRRSRPRSRCRRCSGRPIPRFRRSSVYYPAGATRIVRRPGRPMSTPNDRRHPANSNVDGCTRPSA